MNGLRHRVLWLPLVLAALPASAAQWEVRATGQATVAVSCDQAPVASANYVFWGPRWKWAGARLALGKAADGKQPFSGSVPALGLELGGSIDSPAPNQLRYAWTIAASRALEGIIGGGIEFRLVLDSPSLGGTARPPELLPNHTGWTWEVAPGDRLVATFAEPIANVYFERGQKHTIRAMFLGSDVPKGTRTVAMTLTLPRGGRVAKSLAERYGPADTSSWHQGAMLHDKSPVDLGFLNHRPAGKHGFVKARGDQLVFEDGTPARFWGGNIAAYAIFADKEHIRAQARRIAQLGYNLMRFHHHDSMRWVGRTVIDKSRADSQHLDAEVMERLDYWIKCLKDEGVYVWLDLHVGRLFKQGDGIAVGFDEILRRSSRRSEGAEIKGYCYFNERIEELMKDFNAKYLGHVNKHTGLAYKDEPALMGLLVTNENDLTCHFGNLMLPDKNNPVHNKIFDQAVRAFATAHKLPYDATWRTWVPGPSKLFLADREHRWNRRMLDHLASIGVRVPVATTHMWGGMILCGLPPLVAGGVVDVHSYGGAEALSVNPRHKDNFVSYVAAGQALGKPVAITEWNVPWPNADRFTAPLYMASVCALQEWDAPMIYNYSQRTFGKPTRPSTWTSFPDPAITGVTPAAALLYRQAHVSPAAKRYVLKLDRETLYYQPTHPRNAATLRTLVEQSKIALALPDVKELDWDAAPPLPEGIEVVADTNKDFIPPGQPFVRSDTGELTRNWVKGYQLIDTARTQAAHGWLGGETLTLEHASFRIATPKAAVIVSSLDGEPIPRSGRLLLTAVARVVASPGNKMPLLSEPVRGTVVVEAPAGLSLVPLAGDGTRLPPVAAPRADGRYTLTLPPPRGTHWFLLAADGRAR